MIRNRVALALSFVFLLALAVPASAQEDVAFLVKPGPGASTDPEGSYFVLEAEPGETLRQKIGFRNDGDDPLTIVLSPVDTETAQFGGVSYGLETDEKVGVATWLEIAQEQIVLEPGASRVVGFDVSVPPDAGPGVHLGGISAFVPKDPKDVAELEGDDQAGASIDVRTRRILAVQVNLPGPLKPKVAITGVEAAARPDGVYLEVAMENDGTDLTKGSGRIEIPGEDFATDFELDTFVPGTSIAYPIKWRDSVPNGEYQVRVRLEYEPNNLAEFEGTFSVAEDVQDELDDRQVGAAPEGSDGAGGNLIVYLLIGAVLLMAAVALYMRKQLDAARAAAGSASTEPSPSAHED